MQNNRTSIGSLVSKFPTFGKSNKSEQNENDPQKQTMLTSPITFNDSSINHTQHIKFDYLCGDFQDANAMKYNVAIMGDPGSGKSLLVDSLLMVSQRSY